MAQLSQKITRAKDWMFKTIEHPAEAPDLDRKPIIVLLASTIIICLLWYYGRIPFYRKVVGPALFADEPRHLFDLYGYYFMAASSVVTRMLIPLALIVWVFKERPKDYGYRIKGTMKLGWIYLGLLLFMLPLLYYASGQPEFTAKYPMYKFADSSPGVFFAYELSYVLVFLSGESFWRGFMVFGLAPRFGLYSLPIMAIPYAMIHFGKPFPEAMGAIITALVLGYLAIKHRSFWFGVALHSTIGIAMDVLCLWRMGKLGPLFGF